MPKKGGTTSLGALKAPGATTGRLWDCASYALLAITVLLVLWMFRDYGTTWDEDVHNWYGNLVLDYYLSGFEDRRALTWMNLYLYGAAFDMTAAALNRFSTLGVYETRHLLNGFVGVLGLIGAWKTGRHIAGPRAGFLAIVLLLTIPNYYGQMFNNPKDIPFAVGGIWAVYYITRLISHLPSAPLSLAIRFGVAIGLALGIRIGGLLFPIYAVVTGALFGVWRGIETGSPITALRETGIGGARVLLPAMIVAYPVMLIFWPWAQQAPLSNPLQSLSYFSHVTFPFDTLFAGHYYPAENLPLIYLPTFVVLALPELTLVLALAALPAAIAREWNATEAPNRTRCLQYCVLGVAILLPILYAVTIRAVLFDGMRHFIFVLPPIAVAAAVVADAAFGKIALLGRRWRNILAGLGGLYAIDHLAIMVMLHPDQYIYYNGLVGGVAGAQHWFKTDYWGNSYAEAARGLTHYLEETYGADFPKHTFTVGVCGPPISATNYFPPNLVFSKKREAGDFFIAFTKDDCDKSLPGKEVFRVERMGTLLSVVLDRRGLNAPPPDHIAAAP